MTSLPPSLPRGPRPGVTGLSNLGGQSALRPARRTGPPALGRRGRTSNRFIGRNIAGRENHESTDAVRLSNALGSHTWEGGQSPCVTSKTRFSIYVRCSGIGLATSTSSSTTLAAPRGSPVATSTLRIALLFCPAGDFGRARVALLRSDLLLPGPSAVPAERESPWSRRSEVGSPERRGFHNRVTTRESPWLESAPASLSGHPSG